MRVKWLVLNILICASLATNTPELAADTSAKTSKSKSHKQYKARIKKKSPTSPGDVWARIRSGMKIPRPIAGQTQASKKINRALPKSTLNMRSPAATINCTPPRPAKTRQANALGNKNTSHLRNKKTRSRIDFHPELRRRIGTLRSRNHLKNTSLNGSTALTTSAKRTTFGPLAKTPARAKPCAARTVWHKSRQAMIDERINSHIAAYTQNPGFLHRVAKRAHPYLYYIVEGLSKNRLPLELALLPIVESAYQPTARSPKNAAGLWQFIPSTGKDFNLVQNSDYDERLDIPESTHAAIRFLSGLKNHFKGDWLLALAAYNSGQGTVDNAISRNQAEGLATDFWSLRLPEETQNYVPRLLALSNIFANPARYGIKLPSVRNEPYFVKVNIDREFDINYLAEKDISTIAKLANLAPEQFSRLNPGYLNKTLPRHDSYAFLMPVANAEQLHQNLASIAQFMTAPTSPVKSAILIKEPRAKNDAPKSSMSLVSRLASNKVTDLYKFSTAFLSLNLSKFCSKYS